MFALLVINNVDEYIGQFYLKYEISGTDQGHEIINGDEFLKFDWTIMQNQQSYYWNRMFQFLWTVILIADFGIKAVDGIDLIDHQLLYGFEPTLNAIMFFTTPKRHGVGVSTIADIWIGLFPISMTIIYIYLKSKSDA